MKYIGTFITIILLSSSGFLHAQVGRGIISEKNLFKINVIPLVNADLSYNYERVLNKHFSVEIGAGLLLPFYGYEPDETRWFVVEDDTMGNPDYGYTIRLQPRFYMLKTAPEQGYIGLQLKRKKRNFIHYDKSIIYYDVNLILGVQRNSFGPVIVDYSVGIGVRYKKNEFDRHDNGIMSLSVPIGLKIGFVL